MAESPLQPLRFPFTSAFSIALYGLATQGVLVAFTQTFRFLHSCMKTMIQGWGNNKPKQPKKKPKQPAPRKPGRGRVEKKAEREKEKEGKESNAR